MILCPPMCDYALTSLYPQLRISSQFEGIYELRIYMDENPSPERSPLILLHPLFPILHVLKSVHPPAIGERDTVYPALLSHFRDRQYNLYHLKELSTARHPA